MKSEPIHVIPLRKNAKLWKPNTPGARARNEAVRSSKYLGRALWRQLTGYHRRSRGETKMHCLKLLGQRLSARLRSASRGDPIPCGHPQWLHSSWHSQYTVCRLNPSGVRARPTSDRFVQQGHFTRKLLCRLAGNQGRMEEQFTMKNSFDLLKMRFQTVLLNRQTDL